MCGTILNFIYYFENEEFKFLYYVIIFALLNFELFCAYYMFVPYVYSALWVYFCIYSKKNYKKIICKKNIVFLSVTLLLPFLLGFIYHITPGIYNIFNINVLNAIENAVERSSYLSGKGLAVDGYIYINFYSNFILFIPLVIYYIYNKRKERKLASFDIICFIFWGLFILLLILGIAWKKVSIYYTMKNYYILWMLMLYMNFISLMYIYEKNKKMPYILVFGYILLLIFSLIFIKVYVGPKEINKNENTMNFFEIYGFNKTTILERPEDFNLKEIDILKYAKENLDFENYEIEVMGETEQMLWAYDFLRYVNYDDYFQKFHYGEHRLRIKRSLGLFKGWSYRLYDLF